MAFTCTIIHEFKCVTTIIVNFMNECNKDLKTNVKLEIRGNR